MGIKFPSLSVFPVLQEGKRIIYLIEAYKTQYGKYPADLGQLGIKVKYGPTDIRGIKYELSGTGESYVLVCFSKLCPPINWREIYTSNTKEWHTVK